MFNLELWKQKKKEQKLTFTMLANMSGVPKRTLEDIFAGRTPTPRIDTVESIEKALSIFNETIKSPPTEVERLTDKEKQWLSFFRKQSPVRLKVVCDVLKAICPDDVELLNNISKTA